MPSWFTPTIASIIMLTGVFPAVLIIAFLHTEWKKPGVLWFLLSIVSGGLWALLFPLFTLIQSPELTLAIANFFWAVIPMAAVTMFLFAYEYVSGTPASMVLIAVVFLPIILLFGLSWSNPGNLVFTPSYYVDASGVLHFPAFGGILKILVVKVYGYLLVTVAAGMFLGEVIRTRGTRRRQAVYILLIFSALAVSTLVKVAELVPIYFDPTSVVFSLSGLAFAVSTYRHGFLKYVPIAREYTFEEVEDAILVVGPENLVLDANQNAYEIFGSDLFNRDAETVLGTSITDDSSAYPLSVTYDREGREHHYSLQKSGFEYGRGAEGAIIVLTDITPVKKREKDLDLFKQILSRIFRHNLRNDLMVISGYSDLIASSAKGEIAAFAEKIGTRAENLIITTEKAREIEDILTDDTTIDYSLHSAVENAIEDLGISGFDSRIHTDIDDLDVEAHPKLDLAIQELLENAATHGGQVPDPQIRIFTSTDQDSVILYIEDNGPGIPDQELAVLRAEEETDLQHGSGIGLWLVRWIVERSKGELVTHGDSEGTRIGIRLALSGTED